MKIGHGTVKKYSREYHRTLKTGEKRNIQPNKFKLQYQKTKIYTQIKKKF